MGGEFVYNRSMQRIGKIWFLAGIVVLMGLFLFVSLPAPVEQVRIPLNGKSHGTEEVALFVPRWGWVGRPAVLQAVLYQVAPEKMILRVKMETSPDLLGSGEEVYVVQGTAPVQWAFSLTSMTPGRKIWRMWLWAGDSQGETLLLVREGTLRVLGLAGVPVFWIQVGIVLIVVLLIFTRIAFQTRPPRLESHLVNCDKINKN